MRLHTDTLTAADVYAATAHLPGVYATVTEHGSRSRKRAFEVRLEGNGYPRNSGRYGSDSAEQGATWDEWGSFFAALFAIDPDMLCGSAAHPAYRDAQHFHAVTAGRFEAKPGTLPTDTHKRHTWEWDRMIGFCKKCSAVYVPRAA